MANLASAEDRKQPGVATLKQARRWARSVDMQLSMGCKHPDWPGAEQVERAQESLERLDNILQALEEAT